MCFFIQGKVEFALTKTNDQLFDSFLRNYVYTYTRPKYVEPQRSL